MDISIVTSLYKSELFLLRYLVRIKSFNRSLSKMDINCEFILIANDINIKEEAIITKCKLSNMRVVRVPRETLYASWNRGIREASSDIIVFWNVDDIKFPKAVLSGVNDIRKGAELVYFPFFMFGIGKVTFLKKRIRFPFLILRKINVLPYNRELFMKGCMCGPFFMFNRKVVDKIGPFDESFTIAGDFEWFARASFNNVIFKKSNRNGGIFFVHFNNISGNNYQIHVNENQEVSNRYSDKY
jgi:hypothetical protein